ncbi:hypothetical protein N5D61_24645 [Pseudomonas sp. GD03842]|uniref:hypothetical protein n=1 Tax=Pseudomonas sp. GD03842 TaxID=2975385 RepID=UPI00244B65C1|nr:hypothetical protein [Pseudomonas sp. GD03842]MDH0749518.1 hypothetical protein [Pseudomonas sp. GD03842]
MRNATPAAALSNGPVVNSSVPRDCMTVTLHPVVVISDAEPMTICWPFQMGEG